MKRLPLALGLLVALGSPLALAAVMSPAAAGSFVLAKDHAGMDMSDKAEKTKTKKAPKSKFGVVVERKKVGSTVVSVYTPEGHFTPGDNKVVVRISDTKGKPMKASVEELSVYMPPMGSMKAMRANAKLEPTKIPGIYEGVLNVEMKGPWKVTVTYKDKKGPHRTSFNMVAK